MTLRVTNWRKSTYSAQQTDCVEIGRTVAGAAVRDTKDRTGAMLTFDDHHWHIFVDSVKAGTHDQA